MSPNIPVHYRHRDRRNDPVPPLRNPLPGLWALLKGLAFWGAVAGIIWALIAAWTWSVAAFGGGNVVAVLLGVAGMIKLLTLIRR